MKDQTPFEPRIVESRGFSQYEDNTVFADITLEQGILAVHDWYSAIQRQGCSRRALEWLNKQDTVTRIQVVESTDDAMPFWHQMFQEGLVHEITDKRGVVVFDCDSGEWINQVVAKPAITELPARPDGTLTGKQAAQYIKDGLQACGLPRNSTMRGGEITGWTTHYGSTGFSLRFDSKTNKLDWHVVISGRPHLRYKEDDDGHCPLDEEKLTPRVKKLFEDLGLTVHSAKSTGYSTSWDDDVSYNVVTDHPKWLEAVRQYTNEPGF